MTLSQFRQALVQIYGENHLSAMERALYLPEIVRLAAQRLFIAGDVNSPEALAVREQMKNLSDGQLIFDSEPE